MSNFDDAVAFVLANEGDFVNDPADPGGATNKGISLRFLRTLSADALRKYGIFASPISIGVPDVQALTDGQIVNIYKGEFWNELYGVISDQNISNFVFDMVVNHGDYQGIKILQRACWAVDVFRYGDDDGVMGQHTLALVNGCDPAVLAVALKAQRAGYMLQLVNANPKLMVELHGWLNRCYKI